MAADAGGDGADCGDPVLRHPQCEAAEVSVDEPGCPDRDPGLDPGLGGVQLLRVEFLPVQQDLRLVGGCDHLPAVVVDHQCGAAVRCGVGRRAGAGAAAAG